jgi:large subunit ribosomal protein L17
MNKRVSKIKLGRTKSHRQALIRNQMRSLFDHGFVVTTTAKAKVLKQKTESFLSKISKESLETRRLMHITLGEQDLVNKVAEYVQKTDKKVSIVKFGFRDGDNAETSKVSLLGYTELFGKKKVQKRKSTKSKGKKVVQEKQEKVVPEEKKADKGLLNIKDRFVKKERATSRSGL